MMNMGCILPAIVSVPLMVATACGFVNPPAAHKPPDPVTARSVAQIPDEGKVTYSVTLRPGECHATDNSTLPDQGCTPGSVDPKVTQATISSTICAYGWTRTVRPPESQTEAAKFDVAYPAYSLSGKSELDHLIPLELGGSNDITNLWPELGRIPNPKDSVEDQLRKDVCDGMVSLVAAQDAIARDWRTAETVVMKGK